MSRFHLVCHRKRQRTNALSMALSCSHQFSIRSALFPNFC
jgi:hypothetical protein